MRALIAPSGVVVPVVAGGDVVRTPCGAKRRLRGGAPIARAEVVVDPGHGGDEPGAAGPTG